MVVCPWLCIYVLTQLMGLVIVYIDARVFRDQSYASRGLTHPLGDRLFSVQESIASYFFSFHSLWSLAGEVCSLDVCKPFWCDVISDCFRIEHFSFWNRLYGFCKACLVCNSKWKQTFRFHRNKYSICLKTLNHGPILYYQRGFNSYVNLCAEVASYLLLYCYLTFFNFCKY